MCTLYLFSTVRFSLAIIYAFEVLQSRRRVSVPERRSRVPIVARFPERDQGAYPRAGSRQHLRTFTDQVDENRRLFTTFHDAQALEVQKKFRDKSCIILYTRIRLSISNGTRFPLAIAKRQSYPFLLKGWGISIENRMKVYSSTVLRCKGIFFPPGKRYPSKQHSRGTLFRHMMPFRCDRT